MIELAHSSHSWHTYYVPDPGRSIALPMTNDYRLGRILERFDQVRAFVACVVHARVNRMVSIKPRVVAADNEAFTRRHPADHPLRKVYSTAPCRIFNGMGRIALIAQNVFPAFRAVHHMARCECRL